ncbi:lipocalin family protein, partial [Salmonella enterica]|uniref:lipocalin family protein n=1 Tax=Salmonella enterica TaxID=28901 RepID=UPI003857238E
MKLWPVVTGVAIALTLVACKSPTPPKGVQPISGFDASRYLGKWYEVARLENRFERGLEGTVAKLAMRQPFVLFKGLTFQKLCLPGAFRPGDHHNKMLRPGLCVVHAS